MQIHGEGVTNDGNALRWQTLHLALQRLNVRLSQQFIGQDFGIANVKIFSPQFQIFARRFATPRHSALPEIHRTCPPANVR